MNIIQLIDENKYNFEQKLNVHTNVVCNVVEIKEIN